MDVGLPGGSYVIHLMMSHFDRVLEFSGCGIARWTLCHSPDDVAL